MFLSIVFPVLPHLMISRYTAGQSRDKMADSVDGNTSLIPPVSCAGECDACSSFTLHLPPLPQPFSIKIHILPMFTTSPLLPSIGHPASFQLLNHSFMTVRIRFSRAFS